MDSLIPVFKQPDIFLSSSDGKQRTKKDSLIPVFKHPDIFLPSSDGKQPTKKDNHVFFLLTSCLYTKSSSHQQSCLPTKSSSHHVFIALRFLPMHLTSSPKSSPEIDDTIAQNLEDTAQSLTVDCEQEISQQLGLELIPAMKEVPHQSLERITNQLWSNSVTAPLDPDLLAIPPPLPRPKPDLGFRNSLGLLADRSNESSGRPVGTGLCNARQ